MMSMENEHIYKQMFFANYAYGNARLKINGIVQQAPFNFADFCNRDIIEECTLVCKPLEEISEDEIIELARLARPYIEIKDVRRVHDNEAIREMAEYKDVGESWQVSYTDNYQFTFFNDFSYIIMKIEDGEVTEMPLDEESVVFCYQYLQRQGYLVSWMNTSYEYILNELKWAEYGDV